MKNQININPKKTFKIIFALVLSALILSCSKEEPEFICNGDFFLEKRIVRDTSAQYSNAFPFVKKCFKIASVSKSTENQLSKLNIKLKETGNGALGNYLTFTLYYQNDDDFYTKSSRNITLSVSQYLYDDQQTGINFNAYPSLKTINSNPKIQAGVHNFKILNIDKEAKTLTFTIDKIVGITGHDSYIEYVGFSPITIKIPE